MIIPVIMAGGTGSRLWPISRENFPKQFVSFREGEPSLFQQSLQRLEGLAELGNPIVLCNEAHRFLVAEQLRQIGMDGASIVLEPLVRNTAPALTLAALIAEEENPDACLLVLAADHVIEGLPAFHATIHEGAAQAGQGRLVTFGLPPQSPETGYGYIRRGATAGKAYRVDRFVEKPDLETARSYLASGDYYWNSGMFMFRARDYLGELERFAPAILENCRQAHAGRQSDADFIRVPAETFGACEAISIDYAVMEHTQEAVVVPLEAAWNDLGAWEALWERGEKDANNNVVRGDVVLQQVESSYVHANSRLVSVIGMDHAVVVETADAVLVTSMEHAQQVKELVQRLGQEDRGEVVDPARVRRPWGSYESIGSGEGFQVKRIVVDPQASLSLQLHHHRAEHWTVVKGRARVTCGEKAFDLEANQSTYIPVETRHRLENLGDEPVVLVEVQCGDYLGEDDIVRFDDVYGRSDSANGNEQ